MRSRIWQLTTASLAIGCLTFTAPAQLDTERTEQRDRPGAEQREGEQQQLRIGTIDLERVSEAYKKSQKDRQARGGEGDQEEGLQEPAQAQPPQGQSGIDRQMLNKIKEQAREVADEEDVDFVVLEVLHEGQDGDAETVDLTDQLVQRIEQGQDDQGEERRRDRRGGEEDEANPLMDRADEAEDEADDAEDEEEVDW